MNKQNRTVRIIGGKWRGRKVTFADKGEIRPTSDRIRETLFNWLSHDIHGARCLDLFGGSGALSLEALSRGAGHVTLIDRDPETIRIVEHNFHHLHVDPHTYRICQTSASAWLADSSDEFDIVFIDPPFDRDLITETITLLWTSNIATHLVYIESDNELDPASLPASWSISRQKRAGNVHYSLCEIG